MNDGDLLAQRFETHREHLRAVAYRMLGSSHEADDAVQESWLRLTRTDADAVDNLAGWLTTVVSRVCLDMLRARATRPGALPDESPDPATVTSPEDEALLADSVGLALLVVLDTLVPAERLAFVLHDIFAVSFEEIAPIVGRTPVAARQLASRARRRVQSDPAFPKFACHHSARGGRGFPCRRTGRGLRRATSASRSRCGPAGRCCDGRHRLSTGRCGGARVEQVMHGVDAVARVFAGGAKAARLALVDGLPGAVVSVGGRPMAVFDFTVRSGRVVSIELLADPETLSILDLEPVRGAPNLRGSLKGSGLVTELEADHRARNDLDMRTSVLV